MDQLNSKLNEDTVYKMVKVLAAQTQIVAGLIYYLTVLAAPTNCKKSSGIMDSAKCAVDKSQPEKVRKSWSVYPREELAN
ncbi:unnamed protein product [Gongylonema pulchrum]|uniref:Cystatin domain-containing protein n=1 Tax=Gongylonema pulchrum TaxID=637853 RepID=A0A183EMD3_9BILA|nr:unnamed protein product [Gongylonema pulchrum]